MNVTGKTYQFIKSIISEYIWVIIFSFLVMMLYHQARQSKMATYDKLEIDLKRLKHAQVLALKHQEDLQLRIKSQDDPLWLQMVLMRKLGVTPEGQTKVHFIDSTSE